MNHRNVLLSISIIFSASTLFAEWSIDVEHERIFRIAVEHNVVTVFFTDQDIVNYDGYDLAESNRIITPLNLNRFLIDFGFSDVERLRIWQSFVQYYVSQPLQVSPHVIHGLANLLAAYLNVELDESRC